MIITMWMMMMTNGNDVYDANDDNDDNDDDDDNGDFGSIVTSRSQL